MGFKLAKSSRGLVDVAIIISYVYNYTVSILLSIFRGVFTI